MATAYSYIRWSSDKQTEGDSNRRQQDAASIYAAKHGLTLAHKTYRDAGISAFKGKNAEKGELSLFLKAVDNGSIEPGSKLLIENLDRLSRQPVMTSLRLFQDIIERGITIITLTDERIYNTTSINENWTEMIVALSVMSRSHDEQKRKGDMIAEKWAVKRADPIKKFTSQGPSWLKLDKDKNKWVPEKRQVSRVQKVFELARKGNGAPAIADLLNAAKIETLTDRSEFWTQGTVMAVLKSEAVIGHYQERHGPLRIEGYYGDPVVPKEVFYEVQRQIANRSRKGGKRGENVANLFSGLLHCSCGSKMRFVNGNKKYLYLRCVKAYANAGCDAGSFPYMQFEDDVLSNLLLTAKNIDNTAVSDTTVDPTLIARAEVEEKRAAVNRLLAVVIAGKSISGGSAAAAKMLAKLELELEDLEHKVKTIVKPAPTSDLFMKALTLLDEHEQLKANPSTELTDLRLALMSLIRDLVSKIVVPIENTIVGKNTGIEYRRVAVYGQASGALIAEANRRKAILEEANKSKAILEEARLHKVILEPAYRKLLLLATSRVSNGTLSEIEGLTGDGGCWVGIELKDWKNKVIVARRFVSKRTREKAPKVS